MMEHIDEYINPKLFDEICQKEREAEAQVQRDLDYCADDIDDGEEASDVYAFFLRDHEMDERDFKDEMYDRGIDIYDVDLSVKKN